MGLGRSKEEAPPDDAAPPAPAETPPPSGVNFTSDEEEAVQVRKAARARPSRRRPPSPPPDELPRSRSLAGGASGWGRTEARSRAGLAAAVRGRVGGGRGGAGRRAWADVSWERMESLEVK